MKHKLYAKILTTATLCVLLPACQTTPNNSTNSPIDSALERAAYKAAHQGKSGESVAYLEKIYSRNSESPEAAFNLAYALREQGEYLRASTILSPFANAQDADIAIQTEYSAIQLSQGHYEVAERFARKALQQNGDDPLANNYLGIALDAQNKHDEAGQAFRRALDHWNGDPTGVMNNLALNLTSQGQLKEAMDILEKAQSLRPEKMEIERNLRIVRALQETHGGYADTAAPKPKTKPSS